MYIIYGTQVALIILFIIATLLFLFMTEIQNKWKINNQLLILFYVALVIIAVTRPETTADTDNYIDAFKDGFFSDRIEPMFALIVRFAQFFSYPVIVGFTIYTIFSITPRFYFIKKQSANIWASIMVYMSYCYMAQDIVAIRSAVASAFVLFVIQFKMQNKPWHMVATIAIATLFHYTALIFLVFFVINPEKNHRGLYLAMLIGSYLLYFIGFDIRIFFPFLNYLPFLDYNLNDYNNSTAEVFGTLNGPQILRLTTCLLFWIYVDKIKSSYPHALTYLKVFTISLCMFPLFSSIATMGYRLYEIFASAETIGIPLCFMGIFRREYLNRAAIIVYTFYFFFFTSISNIAYWDPISF